MTGLDASTYLGNNRKLVGAWEQGLIDRDHLDELLAQNRERLCQSAAHYRQEWWADGACIRRQDYGKPQPEALGNLHRLHTMEDPRPANDLLNGPGAYRSRITVFDDGTIGTYIYVYWDR